MTTVTDSSAPHAPPFSWYRHSWAVVALAVIMSVSLPVVAGGTAGRHTDPAFSPSRTLRIDWVVDDLAADGTRAAFLWDGYTVEVWDSRTGKRHDAGGADSGISSLTIAGDVVGYLAFEETNTLQYRSIDAGEFAHMADLYCGRSCVDHVVGDGDLLVYNSWRNTLRGIEKAILWRIRGNRAVPIMRGTSSLYAAAVNSGRIVLLHPPRGAALISKTGASLARYRFAQPVRAIRLGGRYLAALLPQKLIVLDVRTGAPMRSWAVPKRTRQTDVRLEDVQDGLVVYVVDRQIHLRRISDGSDRVIPLPAEARPPVRAQLEPPGLFYSWALPLGRDQLLPNGRLAFAPMARVTALF